MAAAYIAPISHSSFVRNSNLQSQLYGSAGKKLSEKIAGIKDVVTKDEPIQRLVQHVEKSRIQQYFKSSPEERKGLRTFLADSVRETYSVFEILDWSTKTDVRDACDAAVDLLAQSSDITLKVAIDPILEHLLDQKVDQKVATLISGIARARHIPIQERLKVISQQLKSDKRVIKESVADALLLLADEANESRVHSDILEITESHLRYLASDEQPDKFIQRYARDIIDEFP